MTTPAEPDLAGVARRPLRAVYAVTVPGVGAVSVLRPRLGALSNVTLQLDAAAIARATDAGGASVAAVSFHLPSFHDVTAWGSDPRASALRDLLVERSLLAHPAWLLDEAGPADLRDDERWTLDMLRAIVSTRLTLGAGGEPVECDGCRDHRTAAPRRELAELERALISRRSGGRLLSSRELQDLATRVWQMRAGFASVRDGPCPHAELASQGLAALVRTHEELVFELASVLAPGMEERSLVLGPFFETVLLPRWLTGRARTDDRWYGYGYRRRDPSRRSVSWARLRDRARDATELPPAQREAVTYAAAAWGITSPPGALGWTPPAEPVASPALRVDADEAPLDVAAQVPSFAVKRPPPKPAPPKPAPLPSAKPTTPTRDATATPKARTPKGKPAEKPAEKPKAAEKPVAKAAAKAAEKPKAAKSPRGKAAPVLRPVSREVLRAVGLHDALIDEMVREGRLVELEDGSLAHPTGRGGSRR